MSLSHKKATCLLTVNKLQLERKMKRQGKRNTKAKNGLKQKLKFPLCFRSFSFRQAGDKIIIDLSCIVVALCFSHCSCTQHSFEVCTKRFFISYSFTSCSSVEPYS